MLHDAGKKPEPEIHSCGLGSGSVMTPIWFIPEECLEFNLRQLDSADICLCKLIFSETSHHVLMAHVSVIRVSSGSYIKGYHM